MEKSPVVMAEEGEHSGAKELPKPKISMSDLTFVIGVYTTKSKKLTVVEFGADREFNPNDRVKIEIVDLSRFELPKSGMDDVMITWEVVYKKDWQNIVTIVKGRRSLDTNLRWLFNDLLAPEDLIRRGLTGDVKVSLNGDLLDKISLEIFIESDQRYFSPEDTLRYLQCFFPSKN
ncbi:hypothetical protein [Arabidopsis thaliana]|uniref:Uncharacterized protein F8F6_130 n=1 Tax=Arabidopsis thaliana TaxID=3702 RepID=Q9LZB7_ARATH|nr:hypothetical protein [Arabidopsis thaliana]